MNDLERNKLGSAVVLAAALAALVAATMLKRPEPVNISPPMSESIDSIKITPKIIPPTPTYAGTVGKNMNFFNLMLKCGITPQEIKEVEKSARDVYNFRRIYPGQMYELFADSVGRLETLTFSINEESYIEVARSEGKIKTERKTYPFDVVQKTASGLITHSLFSSLQEQSLPQEIGVKLSDIFAWDIDFFTDLHKNDYFRVIYEEKIRFDGLKILGGISAAEFNTKGEGHYAILFENEEGFADYFDENGKSLRKQLLKAPLTYTRISSNFSRRRFHPVLHHYAPHKGIDYAAPTGTPVMSTGNGTVVKASRTRANGNYVKIRHNHNYTTYYLHLSRFAKGIKEGVKVTQGQIIGYVGATGYATGPHLDYRVKKNGQFVNPRRIKLPPANPVSESKMPLFLELRDRQMACLQEIPIEDSRTEHYVESEEPKSHGRDSPIDGSASSSQHSTAE